MKLFKSKGDKETKTSSEEYIYSKLEGITVSKSIKENQNILDSIFQDNAGIIKRPLSLGKYNVKVLLVFIEGMVDKKLLEEHALKQIINTTSEEQNVTTTFVREKIISTSNVKEGTNFDILTYEIMSGNVVLFIEGSSSAIILSDSDIKGRTVGKSDTEQTVRGSREAFVENINTNLVLLRKQIRSPDLQIDIMTIGKRKRSPLALVYLKGVINPQIPKEIKEELSKINIDGVIGSGQIEHIIQKKKWTLLPQTLATERVDRIVGALLEGRAALILDGTPVVLVIPTTLALFLNTADDYQLRPFLSTFLRIIRYLGLYLSATVEALYLAITNFSPGLLPTDLLFSIGTSRNLVPFPSVIEILIIEISLYLLQEAAIRLPKTVSQTVSIVGGIVIGQAVVEAGIVSPIIVIVVAIAAIASFTLPNYTFSIATICIRLFLILCSSVLGLYGFELGMLVVLIHIASLEGYEVKYLEDYSPYVKENLEDTFVIAPQHTVSKRPSYLNTVDTVKQENNSDRSTENG